MLPPSIPQKLEDYKRVEDHLDRCNQEEQAFIYRDLACTDLYFLMRFVLSTKDWIHPELGNKLFEHPFLYERCRDVQFGSESMDIWFRGGGKSTIKTFGRTIFRLIGNSSRTFGFFSVTTLIAQAFLRQVMVELEDNKLLIDLFPEIFFAEPKRESNLWSIRDGIQIKRDANLKDPTICAFGLIDSSYTSKRFSDRNYDDVVNETSISTPEQSRKVTQRWQLSQGTSMPGTVDSIQGTFYAYGDTYHDLAKKGIPVRLFPCFDIIKEKSEFDSFGLPLKLSFDRDKPQLFSREYFEKKEKEMGSDFGAQFLCHALFGSVKSFELDWLRYYTREPAKEALGKNIYILVDPASSKKKGRSYFSLWVVGLGADGNYYILDGVWDRLDLDERTEALFEVHRRWKPKFPVRYERYAFQADIPHIQYVQEHNGYRFDIQEVGGQVPKSDRIERLLPLFRHQKVFFPLNLSYFSHHLQKEVNLTEIFKENEYATWPETTVDDMLDCLSRIAEPDMPLIWPQEDDYWTSGPDKYRKKLREIARAKPPGTSWMSA